MSVYGEFLFIENFISGIVILLLTGKILGLQPGKMRIVIGALMCGIYSFILFVPLKWVVSVLVRIMFSAVAAAAVFRPDTLRSAMKVIGVFYIVSFLMGGITIGLMYMLRIRGITANGSVYIQALTYLQIAAGISVTWILGCWLAELLREKYSRQTVIRQAVIHIDEHSWNMKALVDTGNSLREPVSGNPVAVLSRTAGERIKGELGAKMFSRTCVIPYESIGRKGLMHGIRPDAVTIGNVKTEKVILGISEKDFSSWKGTEKYDVLLHQQLLEGED